MFGHRIVGVTSSNCNECGNCDTNAHRIKECIFSNISWTWLKMKIKQRVGLDLEDPEELFYAALENGSRAGLWLMFGVIHYNLKNHANGTMEEMWDDMRKHRWGRREELANICGNFINCF
jgi:hypothetical protein